ncbi:hypothetical protein AB0L25_24005 [Spirillospora sp. NPDC052242]
MPVVVADGSPAGLRAVEWSAHEAARAADLPVIGDHGLVDHGLGCFETVRMSSANGFSIRPCHPAEPTNDKEK